MALSAMALACKAMNIIQTRIPKPLRGLQLKYVFASA